MSNKLRPIIFIPGLMGSIGGQMLGYKGGWTFGLAAWFYRPFIKQLEGLGYRLNQNLFICYYDWRKNCEDIVEQFLLPLIFQAGRENPGKKIDLLGHSMGGLVGRTYIQHRKYQYNIGRLMVFGTPNRGSVDAYYLWTTGRVLEKPGHGNQILTIIQKGYIWLLAKILGIPLNKNNIEGLHENLPGLQDLLPTQDYGYVLSYKEGDKYVYIPNEYIRYKNNLVNSLNKNIDLLYKRISQLYCFVGTGVETDRLLLVDKDAFLGHRDEDIVGSRKTRQGDGTVIVKSAALEYGEIFMIEGGHGGLLTGSIEYIADIYNIDPGLIKKVKVELGARPLSIIFREDTDMDLIRNRDTIAKFIGGRLITEEDFIIEGFGGAYKWVIFRDLAPGKYRLQISDKDREEYNIFVVTSKIEEEINQDKVYKMEGRKVGFGFEL